jgi:dihydroorotase
LPERLLITGGRVLDPANGIDLPAGDVLVEDGRIATVQAVGAHSRARTSDAHIIEATGLIVAPGFVDLHTHLREPGFEYKETIETGTRAAARGGFTTVCAMPNTEPAMDSRATVDYVMQRAAETGLVRVLPIGAVTKGRAGKQLAEMGELADAGCVGFSDDCEDPQLAGGVMHEGWVSARLGLKGIPAASEENMVARDVSLARETGAHVHIAHLSTAGSVELVRRAKAEGLHVTAEVTPHHLALNHEAVMYRNGDDSLLAYDTNAKMYPPLRRFEDARACLEGLLDGTIDAIATDHAPHAVQEKLCEFDEAANGIIGLETALALSLRAGVPIERLVEALTIGPVRALALDRRVPGLGTLSPGAPADIVVFDPAREWTATRDMLASKGKNTPVLGQTLQGLVVATVYGGAVVHEAGSSYNDSSRLTSGGTV